MRPNNALATATATADAVRSTASRYSATAVGPFMRPSEYTQHLRNTIGTSNTTTNTNNNINNVLATATATADAARPTASRYSATAAGSPMRPSEYMHNARNTIRTINTATNTATNTNNTLDDNDNGCQQYHQHNNYYRHWSWSKNNNRNDERGNDIAAIQTSDGFQDLVCQHHHYPWQYQQQQ
ncbi:hypothetical protein BGW39_005313 [Mortierella sp. 14UC]|nr:hypothetical protein BGW39_005313 [Mortierella sp. 14UC]